MPARSLTEGVALTLVTAATAAPSLHNTQPWRFRLDRAARTVHVHSAPRLQLPATDPDGRAVHISVGAALRNLQAAAVHQGWEPVTRLLPCPGTPDLLAAVRLAGPPRAALLQRPDLHRAIWRRRSSRLPFTPEPVPETVLTELADAARLDGAELHRPGPGERADWLRLTAEAELRNSLDPARRAESGSCVSGPRRDWGLPAYACGPADSAGLLPVRAFDPERPRGHTVFESEPQLLLLTTAHDSPADWLRAGQALQHVLLVLTLHGVRASLLHQAMEWPDLRRRLARPGARHHVPQVLLRVGYGPAGFPTPRRPAPTVLDELVRLPA
ncbi:nitroreductase family protein [Kitasatospora sp. NPDC002227]|uniref:Acg family FMN-binding oxidoreductase n=1 Tax=Kitasatospora sp. NPDC002227 TaxID=3154773 RepID=UPI00332A7A04